MTFNKINYHRKKKKINRKRKFRNIVTHKIKEEENKIFDKVFGFAYVRGVCLCLMVSFF